VIVCTIHQAACLKDARIDKLTFDQVHKCSRPLFPCTRSPVSRAAETPSLCCDGVSVCIYLLKTHPSMLSQGEIPKKIISHGTFLFCFFHIRQSEPCTKSYPLKKIQFSLGDISRLYWERLVRCGSEHILLPLRASNRRRI